MLLKFRSKLYKWLQDGNSQYSSRQEQDDKEYAMAKDPSIKSTPLSKRKSNAVLSGLYSTSSNFSTEGFNIKIFPGAGGLAIETSTYVPEEDSYRYSLHIVPEDDDLGSMIAQIITIESLKV
jgi:hypothetical protein